MADTVKLEVTAPIPEGWTKEQVAAHFHNILRIWASGISNSDVRNVFTAESIKVRVK